MATWPSTRNAYPVTPKAYPASPKAYPGTFNAFPAGGETLEGQITRLASAGLIAVAYYPSNSSGLPLKNLGYLGAAANLLDDTGGCAISSGLLNGNDCFSPLAASGGYLRTATITFTNSVSASAGINPPCHLITVGRFGGTPTVNLIMCAGGAQINYQDADQTGFNAGGLLSSVAGTNPLAFAVHDVFHHVQSSRYGVNGSYVSGTSVNPGTARLISSGARFVIGASNAGTFRSTCDVALVLIADNRIPYAEYSALIDKINAVFGLSSAKHASYVQPEDATLSAPGFTPGKAIPFLGQSNASNYSTVAPTNTWSAATAVLTNQNTWVSPGADPFDDETNQQDPISIDPVASIYGWAAPLAKAEATRYGVNVCIIPCARSAVTMAMWQKSLGNLKRGYLYGSAVWRMQRALAAGMVIPYVVVHQGEAEAIGTQGQRDGWPALAQQLVADIRADLGLPTLPFLFALVRNSTMAAGYVDMHDNKIPSIVTSTIKTFDVPIGGPFEADGVHIQGAGLDTTASNAAAVAAANGW